VNEKLKIHQETHFLYKVKEKEMGSGSLNLFDTYKKKAIKRYPAFIDEPETEEI